MTDEIQDTPSSEHFYSIEEIQPRRFSTEENNNDDSHIQPIENGNHHENPSTIQSVELTNDQPTESEFIQETTTIHQEPTSPSHIQPIDISNQNNSITEDQSDTSSDQNHLNPLVIDNDISNVDTSFQIPTELQDKPIELKAQRQLDDEEIPPAELPVDQIPINTSPESNLIDERPLTELETPYEHHQENENSFVQSLEDEISLNNPNEGHSFNESENVANPITLSSFLPDVITETIEQHENNFLPEPIESEKISIDENLNNNPADFTEEDFPPLPPAANQKLNDEDFPPLPSVTTKSDQTLNQSEPQDVLGNKTLFKQVKQRF
jgi:hypothetical protein